MHMLKGQSRKAHHIQEEMTQWTLVLSAKAKANKAKASMARAKGSKESKTRTRTGTGTRTQWNVGTVESAVTTLRTVGARRTRTKVVQRKNTNPRMQRMLTILTRRNHQMLNQKSKSVDSTCVTLVLMLLKCEGLNGSRLELTWVQERQHGPRAPHKGSGFR